MARTDRTFGQAFGDLICQKRGQEGLTQKELAIKAFDDEAKTRRIIELEKGSVRRPHASTIDPLVVFFNITEEELEKCKRCGFFTADEQTSIGLSREILENLAQRFEHENPDVPDEELIAYLKAKAEELKHLRARLSDLERPSGVLRNQIAAADKALEIGRFDEADEILAAAEEIQLEERTLKEVREQANIRFARGDTALFRGQPDLAAVHYTKAAEYFLGFDKYEAASAFSSAAGQIYEYERRALTQRFTIAIGLAERALSLVEDKAPSATWALFKYRLALLQQNEARARRQDSLKFLGQAINNAQDALSRCSTLSTFDWASLMTLLGNCHLERGHRLSNQGWKADLDFAIKTYEQLSRDPRVETLNQHRCHVFSNLSAAYIEKARRSPDTDRPANLQKAKKAAHRAIELSSQDSQADIWSAAQMNLGQILIHMAKDVSDKEATFLRIQAISAFNASLETYLQGGFTLQMAHTQFLVGRAYLEQAMSEKYVESRETYLVRGRAAYETALQVFRGEPESPQWFESNYYLGLCYFYHSSIAGIADKDREIEDLGRALHLFEIALPGYQHPELRHNIHRIEETIKDARDLLAKSVHPDTST